MRSYAIDFARVSNRGKGRGHQAVARQGHAGGLVFGHEAGVSWIKMGSCASSRSFFWAAREDAEPAGRVRRRGFVRFATCYPQANDRFFVLTDNLPYGVLKRG